MQAAFLVEFAAKAHGGAAPKKFVYRGDIALFAGSEFSVNANDNDAGMELFWTAEFGWCADMRRRLVVTSGRTLNFFLGLGPGGGAFGTKKCSQPGLH